MLVAAMVGSIDEIHQLYRHAIDERYRFLSYGDACLLFNGERVAAAQAVGNAADSVQKWRNVEVELQTVADIAAAEVNEQAEDIMRRAIRSIAGEKAVVEPLQTAGGDDFHFYTLNRADLSFAVCHALGVRGGA